MLKLIIMENVNADANDNVHDYENHNITIMKLNDQSGNDTTK